MTAIRHYYLPVILVTMSLVACQGISTTPAADMVLMNGTIYTSDDGSPVASAVAISDGRFLYVGDDASLVTGPDTQVVDLGGKAVVPGLLDSHSHPGWVALSEATLFVEDASTKEAMMESIARLVEDHAEREVIIAGYWPNEYFDVTGPTRQELDAIEPDRPVIIYDDWGHTIWVNSKALEMANVTGETPDDVPGFAFYQRDENGQATGWITESTATAFVNNFQSVTPAIEQVLIDYLGWYRSIGVLTVLDAGNFGLDREIYSVISRLDKEGRLPVRYHGAYTLYLPSDYDHAVSTLKKLGEDFNSEMVRIDTMKVFYDGVLETRTADLSEDYLDTPGNSGASLLSREQLHRLVVDLDRERLNLHIHAVGDASTTRALDAIQDAHESLGRAPEITITICHLEVVWEEDIPRFRELGVIANFTPHWWIGGDREWVDQGIGDKSLSMQRGGKFVEAGAIVTFSSDITDKFSWKTNRANPFLGMQMAHNRQEGPDGPDAPVFPQESDRVSREAALAGYTNHTSLQLGRGEIGSITVGKVADLLVLDRDPMQVDRYDIQNTQPVAVLMRGEVVSGSLSRKD